MTASVCCLRNAQSTGLPDAAAIEAASWVEKDNDRTVLIDASTAHRVNEDWTYGFPGRNMLCKYASVYQIVLRDHDSSFLCKEIVYSNQRRCWTC